MAPAGYRRDRLTADFEEFTARAEDLVAEATGLRSPSPARARVTDRLGWVDANISSMQRLLAPTLRALEERRASGTHGPAHRMGPGSLAAVGRRANGIQIGLVLAWLSTRVLGQYDLLLADEPVDDQDIVYFVGPNVVAVESRHGFPPRQFRLWLAIHEVTHRCQFTAVPWLRDHFLTLVDRGLGPLAADPNRMIEAVRRAVAEARAGRNPLDGAGMIGLLATPEQLDAVERIQALMSLLEGHGDVTMDRAGASAVPGAARFSRVLRERREQVHGPARIIRQALGIEAKMRQYAEGENFVHAVEEVGGSELFDRVWRGPEWLPTLAEIRAPDEWVDRVRLLPALG
jgi:coenzyme F420 biosynthesis associated uncharacterized protein